MPNRSLLRFFDDDDDMCMTVELCHNGSLTDTLRPRCSFTEPDARFFLVQIIGPATTCPPTKSFAVTSNSVIHSSTQNMNIKVGDSGLAALIENPGERKKTICGTPNYIAPEVLFGTVLTSTPGLSALFSTLS
ncbi:kinase-like domain-containing protein [Boletus reticuloceps]|uniref:Kinase-like domain-containing protein n=1 Tax=Boletus reticuloceps TaxID=495285 RepID=A0A8I3A351_9AGAM|nr:kinase-like domain-containing protein [Boletus reticuloceps]